MNNSLPANYDEKITCLSGEEFFDFFSRMNVEPRWVNSAGKPSIQIIGRCHHGQNHSAVFDPETRKVTCFSECGHGMFLHTWVKRALDMGSPQEAKDFIENWMDGQEIDFSSRDPTELDDYTYHERPYEPEHIEPLPGIGEAATKELYSQFDTSQDTLGRLVWHTKEGIDVEQLSRFDVAYYPKHKTIILPHHNINGEIVGLYERSFLPLRKEMKELHPEAEYKWLCRFPRAKYLPLLKEGHFAEESEEKTSWSFPNNRNLYGLHLAKDAIRETGKAIIFEGAKSVMLAHQYGYPFAVASHTFGANINHISMLIECGAKEIILAFDRQYETTESDNQQWRLYEKKTRELAERVKAYVNVSRIVDYDDHQLLNYKDAPIDQGAEVFRDLFERREKLVIDGVSQREQEHSRRELSQKEILAKLSKPKATVEEHNAGYDDEAEEQQEEETESQDPQKNPDKPAAPLLFRGNPISWEVVTEKKITTNQGAFSIDVEEREATHHYIKYQGQLYLRDSFMKAVFPEYKKHPYKVKFNTADIYRLGSNQRAKLQYHILAQHFPLVEVDWQDKAALESLCQTHKAETAQRWLQRMQWDNGIEKMVSFGVAQEVIGKVSGAWCYSAVLHEREAFYCGIPMTWEEWLTPIRNRILRRRADKKQSQNKADTATVDLASEYKMLSYQNGLYLTLTGDQLKALKAWVYRCYTEGSQPFPDFDEISAAEYSFRIDFERDIEIVPADERKENMKKYNKEHNAEHNKEMGIKRVTTNFDGLQGDQWTTQEILSQGFSRYQLTNLVKHGLIRRVKNGYYERVSP